MARDSARVSLPRTNKSLRSAFSKSLLAWRTCLSESEVYHASLASGSRRTLPKFWWRTAAKVCISSQRVQNICVSRCITEPALLLTWCARLWSHWSLFINKTTCTATSSPITFVWGNATAGHIAIHQSPRKSMSLNSFLHWSTSESFHASRSRKLSRFTIRCSATWCLPLYADWTNNSHGFRTMLTPSSFLPTNSSLAHCPGTKTFESGGDD